LASAAKPDRRVTVRPRIAGWFIEDRELVEVRKTKSRAADVQSDAFCIDQAARHAEACERRTTIGTRLPGKSF
jgi:hypothetical protein